MKALIVVYFIICIYGLFVHAIGGSILALGMMLFLRSADKFVKRREARNEQ